MENIVTAFSGFSVDDLKKAEDFYGKTLGVKTEKEEMGLRLYLPGGGKVFIYAKDNHKPATYTILNFVVKDIDKTVDELTAKGVMFERYDDMPQDDKGVMRGKAKHVGPDIAWFKDPADNIVAIIGD